jgi:hypothetical protein
MKNSKKKSPKVPSVKKAKKQTGAEQTAAFYSKATGGRY